MKERMEFQQLKRMGKSDLVRLLQECDEENLKLKQELEEKEKRVAELRGTIAQMETAKPGASAASPEPGSLADSVIQVNGVMEAAQKAAQQYLERIREMETAKQAAAEAIVASARARAEKILEKARMGADQIKTAGSNVLQNLEAEIDRMLGVAREGYERKAALEIREEERMDAYLADGYGAEAERVPRLKEILDAGETAQESAPKKEDAPTAQGGASSEAFLNEFDQFTAGLSDEFRSAIDDISYNDR